MAILTDFILFYRYLVSDAAPAISKAFKNVFGQDTTALMCFTHVLRNIESKIRCIKKSADIDILKNDIRELERMPSREAFQVGVSLFCAKWKRYPDCVKYIDKNWFQKNSNWFMGARNGSLNIPLTNNAMEKFNSTLKSQGTYRHRMAFLPFLEAMKTCISFWSSRTTFNDICLGELSNRKLWNAAGALVDDKRLLVHAERNGRFTAICASLASGIEEMTAKEEKKFEGKLCKLSAPSFDIFCSTILSCHKVSISKIDYRIGHTCTCIQAMKKFMCKHILAVALHEHLTDIPGTCRSNLIAENNKRGKPKKVTHALLM